MEEKIERGGRKKGRRIKRWRRKKKQRRRKRWRYEKKRKKVRLGKRWRWIGERGNEQEDEEVDKHHEQ